MDDDSSNINIYLGCEEAGGGFTNLYNPSAPTGENRAGSVLRFSLTDTGGRHNAQNAVWDYPLHDAEGSQDSILNVWLHVALAVDIPKQSMRTFIDGQREHQCHYHLSHLLSATSCISVISVISRVHVSSRAHQPAHACHGLQPSATTCLRTTARRYRCARL